ncbi:Dolichyl-phosphate-mannose-protein mannosyltransferase [Halogranum rubrum]|uniref:Dolichyl-phosphate-mannose-protein mannosyltransferase n=1 Tax=Halogranum rubrum TaxID=553466 RepID=A0A1I4I5N9_9EURY|nr:glycosyltransferase family 39 protein [Halogranum rubrum]SFL49699.1 Dolichyl-phosphate-mannose-protein mannosyltransferase [Halogranum rubrum]
MAHQSNESRRSTLVSALPSITRTQLTLGGILLVAMGLRLYRLTSTSLWLDEVTTLTARANLPVEQLISVAVNSSPHPPGYFLALHYWLSFAGTTPFAARFFSVVCGVGAVFFTYKIGRRLFTPRTGLGAALLLAISPMHIQYSREARMYALLCFLTVVSMYYFVRLLEGERTVSVFLGYTIGSICLMYTHMFALFVILAQNSYVLFVTVWSGSELKPRLTVWVGLQALLGAAFAPWLVLIRSYLLGVLEGGGGSLIGWLTEPTLKTLLQTLLSYTGYVRNYPFWSDQLYSYLISFVVLFVALASVGVAFLGYRSETMDYSLRAYLRRYCVVLTWGAAAVLVPYAFSLFVTPIYYTRYTIGALPAFYLLASRGVDTLRSPAIRRTMATILVGGLLITAGIYHTTPSSEQWKSAGEYIDSESEPGELVFLTPSYLDRPTTYYLNGSNLTFETVPPAASGFDDGPDPERTVSTRRFWVVTATTYEQSTGWLGAINSSYTLREHRRFGSVQVYLYTTETTASNSTTNRVTPHREREQFAQKLPAN